jgi:peptidoglycan/LPS O-acetylase OafA/YrhL
LSAAAAAAARFIYFPGTPDLWGAFSYDFPLFHVPAFVAGMLAGRVFLFGPRFSQLQSAAMAVAGMGGVVLLRLNLSELQSNAMLAPLFAVIICGTASHGTGALAARPLVVLGHASYAIYILHFPLRLWWLKLDKTIDLARWPWLDCGLYLALVIATALLVLYFVERPARAYLLRARGFTGFVRRRRTALW